MFMCIDGCGIVWYLKIEFDDVNMMLELFSGKIMFPIILYASL